MTFDDLIYREFADSDHFDKMRHGLLRIREIMQKHKSFRGLTVEDQFNQCVTIHCIAMQTATANIRKLKIVRKREKTALPYSVEEGYEPKPILEIGKQEQKRLNP